MTDTRIGIEQIGNCFNPSVGGGLSLNISEGTIRSNNVLASAVATSITLPNNATSYVEVAANAVVSSNTTGFTAGRYPVAVVVTSGSNITAITDSRTIAEIVTNPPVDNFILHEVPTGTLNGTNKVFTLVNTPIAGSEEIFENGIYLQPGASNDYTISGTTVTFTKAPKANATLLANYRK